jgi:SAM-dependent methyltransferase
MPEEPTDESTLVSDDELTEWTPEATQVDPEFYRNGGISLSESELEALGELHGRNVLVLGAGTGEDALSLINAGAHVTVVDDEESLAGPRELAAAAGLDVNFVEDYAGALAVAFRTADYDIVYSGFGSIDWMGDLGDWASGIVDSLRSGGRLVVYDEHPFSYVFEQEADRLVVANSYFGEAMEEVLEAGGEVVVEASNEEEPALDEAEEVAPEDDDAFETEGIEDVSWTLGDLISALGANGLATLSLLEFPESDRFETAMDRLESVDPIERDRIPSALLLVAVKL